MDLYRQTTGSLKCIGASAQGGLGALRRIHSKVRIHGLEHFQSAFSRQRSWLLFSAVVLSFLVAPE